jgi:hypothetical protein
MFKRRRRLVCTITLAVGLLVSGACSHSTPLPSQLPAVQCQTSSACRSVIDRYYHAQAMLPERDGLTLTSGKVLGPPGDGDYYDPFATIQFHDAPNGVEFSVGVSQARKQAPNAIDAAAWPPNTAESAATSLTGRQVCLRFGVPGRIPDSVKYAAGPLIYVVTPASPSPVPPGWLTGISTHPCDRPY